MVKHSIPINSFDTWFNDLSIEEKLNNTITFGVINQMKLEWLEARYTFFMKRVLKSLTDIDYDCFFVLRENCNSDLMKGNYIGEIWESLEDFEDQKRLYRKRTAKADYDESELNIVRCVKCGDRLVKTSSRYKF